MRIARCLSVIALAGLFIACDNKEDVSTPNPDNQESTIDSISWNEWPHTDCSTSTRPVRDLIAYKLLDVPYEWQVDWMSGTTYIIAPNFGDESSEFTYREYLEQNLCSGTHEAYMNLMEGNIRNTDSGSQEKMETLVMQGLTMINGTYMAEIIGSQMASPYMQLEEDEYGIGYTPFFYCTAMVRDLMKVDMISIDGVMPSKESLRTNEYPFTSHIYAAVRKTQDRNSTPYKLYRFLFTERAADMIDESGYIAIR